MIWPTLLVFALLWLWGVACSFATIHGQIRAVRPAPATRVLLMQPWTWRVCVALIATVALGPFATLTGDVLGPWGAAVVRGTAFFPRYLRMMRHVHRGGKGPGTAWTAHKALAQFARDRRLPWFSLIDYAPPYAEISEELIAGTCCECLALTTVDTGWFLFVYDGDGGMRLDEDRACVCAACVEKLVLSGAVVSPWTRITPAQRARLSAP